MVTATKEKPVSATMVAALADAIDHNGGELERFVGGYWSWKTAPRDHNGTPHPHHGTSTIEALVARGRMEYVEHREGRNGRFPIKARVVEQTDGQSEVKK